MKDLDIRCKACDRFLNIKAVDTIIAQVRCSNSKCKQLNNVKVITNDATDRQITYHFDDGEIAKATTPDDQATKQINNLKAKLEDNESYIAQLEGIVDGQG
jgi:phage FluMu protein Com